MCRVRIGTVDGDDTEAVRVILKLSKKIKTVGRGCWENPDLEGCTTCDETWDVAIERGGIVWLVDLKDEYREEVRQYGLGYVIWKHFEENKN